MSDLRGPNMSREWNLEIGTKMLGIIREERNKAMKKVILTNAFSINMLNGSEAIWFEKISEADARRLIADTFESAVGHVATANLLSEKLDVQVPTNRVEVKMDKDTVLLVAQLKGRLPEGKVILSLDEMRAIPVEFWLVVDNEHAGSI